MAQNYGKQYNGQNLVPQNTISPSEKGDMRYNSATDKVEVYNGSVDPVVTEAKAATLTNKTLSGNTASNLVNGSGTLNINSSGTVTVPNATDTLVGKATTDTLTNKTIDAGSNTISNLTNTNLSGSAAITNANLAAMPANTIKGNNTGGSTTPSDLTASQVNTLLGTVTTVGAIDSAATANGLSISGNTISTQSASATNPGMVNTTTQSFAGAKTFNTSVQTPSAILTGTGGNVTLTAASGTTTGHTLRLPPAQGTNGQLLTNDGSGNLSWSFVSPGTKNYLGSINGVNNNGNFETGSVGNWVLGTATLTSNLPTGVPTFGSGASGNLSTSIISYGS